MIIEGCGACCAAAALAVRRTTLNPASKVAGRKSHVQV